MSKKKTHKFKKLITHTNVIENERTHKAMKERKFQGKGKYFKKTNKNFNFFKKLDGECFVCEKYSYLALVCRHRMEKRAKVNMTET